MKIYLIERTDNWTYDDYDSCVVNALNRESAIKIACSECLFNQSKVDVTTLSESSLSVEEGLILGSFNAG